MFMKHNMENESPHWRGRVWLNINYLVLSALDYYSKGWHPPKPLTTIDFVLFYVLQLHLHPQNINSFQWVSSENALVLQF